MSTPGATPAQQPIDSNNYASFVVQYCVASTPKDKLTLAALGLAGESGEVVDTIKKYLYGSHDLDAAEMLKELGDTLWYLVLLADTLGFSLDDVIQKNVVKLRSRYQSGSFTSEESINRTEK
jgi:NTP pyrophosphatase (non-canonical NTP hydrolase)